MSNKSTREERRNAARAQAERLRQEQAAKEKRTRAILFGVLGVVVLAAVGAVFYIMSQANKSLLEEFDGATPANTDVYGGIVVGQTGTAGEATDGADTLQVYLDFMCPFCGDFEEANAADLNELREAGELNVTYHVLSNLDYLSMETDFSTRSANAAATVADKAPEAFLPFLEAMFENQPAENTEGLSDEQIASIAVEAGVPQEVADSFAAGTYTEWVGVATEQSKRDGITGTPAIVFNGEQVDATAEELYYYNPGVLRTWLADKGVGQDAVSE